MSTPTGPLIASGRAADVFDQGDGTVLRRYRSEHDTELEARVMTWLYDEEVPVPEVHAASDRDLVMDRISGPTMLEDLGRRPWMMVAHARTLAALQRRYNSLTAPDWFPRHDGVPAGSSVVHLDLHPMNVMLGERGPVIIDWTNAGSGQGSFDAAMTYVLISAFEASGVKDRVGQRVIASAFTRSRGRKELQGFLREACVYRLSDPNLTTGETAAVERMLK